MARAPTLRIQHRRSVLAESVDASFEVGRQAKGRHVKGVFYLSSGLYVAFRGFTESGPSRRILSAS
jgi:hypothetical protein